MEIKLEIKTCMECPFWERKRVFTADSWEEGYDWTCKKTGKQIASFVEWNEVDKVPIPDFCPIKSTT